MFNWYYVGQYGQLGPLSEEQMVELIDSGVISADTYVWKRGLPDWIQADAASEFRRRLTPNFPPPPPPSQQMASARSVPPPDPVSKYSMQAYYSGSTQSGGVVSPSSRVAAGVLQLLLPGVGRMYLGYTAIGVLQLVLTICTLGMLWIWPFVDGILILAGTVRHDGYGRVLRD